ncbi:MAG: single-stranded-DNA-specific exonuclease RecJ [Bdellovibrionaceae bacterium]|nr:single-stranded-DNA-specific exonuclease RecJ [Pseudobdellovibrionaceae bacterium]
MLFRPKLSQIKSPMSIDQMDIAVDRLTQAYENQDPILVYGDFDLDGSSGVALIFSGLKALGFKNIFYIQPKRLSEGYGFHKDIVEKYKDKVKLIVTVDVGITGREATAYAKELGIDVIVTDHHLPEGQLPEATAILNPNKGFCRSGLKHLCGVGVGYYLVLAVWMRFKELGWMKEEDFDPKSILDLFIIGTITDLVPMVEENRVLVKHGLHVLERTKRAGLKALMYKLGLVGKRLSSQDIGFRLAPKLNALSRMDKDLLPIEVLLCQDEVSAQRMVDQVLALNNERLQLQKKAEAMAFERDFESEDLFSFVYDEEFHKGVIGLVATKLSQNYNKPAFVGSVRGHKVFGSARMPDGLGLNLVEILSFCPSLKKFGGHQQAAGFELELSKAEDFRNELRRFFQVHKEENGDFGVLDYDTKYDIEISATELTPQLLNWMQKLEPYGVGFEVPVFKVTELKPVMIRVLKEAHLKMQLVSLKHKEVSPIDAIWFHHSLSEEQLDQLIDQKLDIIGSLEWNEYMGKKTPQFLIKSVSIDDL